jgi:hypothetical protein
METILFNSHTSKFVLFSKYAKILFAYSLYTLENFHKFSKFTERIKNTQRELFTFIGVLELCEPPVTQPVYSWRPHWSFRTHAPGLMGAVKKNSHVGCPLLLTASWEFFETQPRAHGSSVNLP